MTDGTGCFALLTTGVTAMRSLNRLLTTNACQLDSKPTYALERSTFVAGAVAMAARRAWNHCDCLPYASTGRAGEG